RDARARRMGAAPRGGAGDDRRWAGAALAAPTPAAPARRGPSPGPLERGGTRLPLGAARHAPVHGGARRPGARALFDLLARPVARGRRGPPLLLRPPLPPAGDARAPLRAGGGHFPARRQLPGPRRVDAPAPPSLPGGGRRGLRPPRLGAGRLRRDRRVDRGPALRPWAPARGGDR